MRLYAPMQIDVGNDCCLADEHMGIEDHNQMSLPCEIMRRSIRTTYINTSTPYERTVGFISA